jgi:OOP family OmpA-OmpF porin
VMGVLAKHVSTNGVSAGGLSQLFAGHKQAILDDPNTPPGLAGALGLGSLAGLGGAASQVGQPRVTSVPTPGPMSVGPAPRRPRLGFLLPAALLAALIIWGIASATRSHEPRGVTAPQPPPAPTLHAPEMPSAIVLPGGKTLDVAPTSAEAQMAHGLSDAATTLPHTYDFDQLTFDYNSATITPSSATTIGHLATMLQAYPTARIRVVGHTDSAGTTGTNQTLSESRANAIKQALVAQGVGADRIETSGEAALQPAPGTKPEEAVNRRADVILLSR